MMNLKKHSLAGVALTVAMTTALVAGSVAPAFAALSGTINIGGSTTVQPLAALLAINYKKINKGVKVVVVGGGSSVGVDGAGTTFDIGMNSGTNHKTKTGTAFSRDALTFIVHPKNKVTALTLAQLKSIWTGKITNWKQLGGADAKILVFGRAAGSGTGDYVNKDTFKNPALVGTIKTYDSNGLLRNAVASKTNAIGYVGMAYASSKVRGVKLNGVLPTRTNAKAGKYPLVRKLWWVTQGAPAGLAKTFVDYSLSSKGQALCNTLYLSLK